MKRIWGTDSKNGKFYILAVRSIYSIADLPEYESYDYRECPYCKAGQKIDALVNSFGYSEL